jgi:hypothetical protein
LSLPLSRQRRTSLIQIWHAGFGLRAEGSGCRDLEGGRSDGRFGLEGLGIQILGCELLELHALAAMGGACSLQ